MLTSQPSLAIQGQKKVIYSLAVNDRSKCWLEQQDYFPTCSLSPLFFHIEKSWRSETNFQNSVSRKYKDIFTSVAFIIVNECCENSFSFIQTILNSLDANDSVAKSSAWKENVCKWFIFLAHRLII